MNPILNGRRQVDNKVRFDKTINLGHVLTIVSLLIPTIIAGIVSWNVMDKRVLVLEEARLAQHEKELVQHERDATQDSDNKEKYQEVKDALKELRASVEKVADKLGAEK